MKEEVSERRPVPPPPPPPPPPGGETDAAAPGIRIELEEGPPYMSSLEVLETDRWRG